MKSFEHWFAEQGKPEIEELPEGVVEGDSGYLAMCGACGAWYLLYCDLPEFDPKYSFCGCSPRCCP